MFASYHHNHNHAMGLFFYSKNFHSSLIANVKAKKSQIDSTKQIWLFLLNKFAFVSCDKEQFDKAEM